MQLICTVKKYQQRTDRSAGDTCFFMAPAIASHAFRRALLRTERLHILGSILMVFVFVIAGSVRTYLFGSHLNHIGLYYAAVLIAYEAAIVPRSAAQHQVRHAHCGLVLDD